MKVKNQQLISLLLPFSIAVFFAIKTYNDNTSSFWSEYSVLLLFVLAFWLVTGLIGVLLTQVIKSKGFEIIILLSPQLILFLGFIFYSFFDTKVVEYDPNENMKMNRLMVDYEKRLDDSITTFPNWIRIAYRELESKFHNPNEFRLIFLGSKTIDSAAGYQMVYFGYKAADSTQKYSKIFVANDTARIITWNEDVSEGDYLYEKTRLETWAIGRMRRLSEDIKKNHSPQ